MNSMSAASLITIALLTPVLSFASTKSETGFKFDFALGALEKTYSGGDDPKFTLSPGLTARLGANLTQKLAARVQYTRAKNYSDSSATSIFAFGSEPINRISALKSQSALLSLRYFFTNATSSLAPYLGAGIGFDSWKAQDPSADTTLDTLGENNTRTKLETTEFIYGGYFGIQARLSKRIGLFVEAELLRYSGAGAEFPALVNDSRPNTALALSSGLSLAFGSREKRERFSSDDSWSRRNSPSSGQSGAVDEQARDSDGDGVPDSQDRCAATPRGAEVNSLGCPLDSDGDGVFDGLDDCPNTPPTALGLVDIYGCPIDADFDGVPDFQDDCPGSAVGAVVDQRGCPEDSDSDGVADGLDDCPATPPGIVVDKFGCPNIDYFSQPLVLNILYPSGSYEVDRPSETKLLELSAMLKATPSVSLKIYGYTDNIGPAEANRTLSEKRARRVRDFLVRNGVAAERITVQGRGETNFVADNKTREGRQRNRRIEIVFSQN